MESHPEGNAIYSSRNTIVIGLPFDRDGHQSEDTAADGDDGHKLGDFAIDAAERPIVGHHTDEIKDDVER